MTEKPSERPSEKPSVVVRGKDTVLSVWISENSVRFSVSRKNEGRFERVDSYSIPLDYLLFKIMEKNPSMIKRYCEFVESLGGSEE